MKKLDAFNTLPEIAVVQYGEFSSRMNLFGYYFTQISPWKDRKNFLVKQNDGI